jgi:DNA primase
MEQVLQRYDLVDGFKRGPDSFSGPCPIHQGTNPTQFRVSLSKNCWNCFGDCNGGGNVLDFVARMENVEPMEAANRLVDWFHLDRAALNAEHAGIKNRHATGKDKRAVRPTADPVTTPGPTADQMSNQSGSTPARDESGPNPPLRFQLELDSSHPYLVERGLTPESIREFGLGYCAKGVMAHRIAIPIRNVTGDLVGYAGRWPGIPPDTRPKYRLPDGFRKSAEIFNLFGALREPAERPLVIVEGFFDVMRLWQLGIRKCVALMGCSLSLAQEALLVRHLGPDAKAIVMFDEDGAGQIGREWVLQRLSSRVFVRVVSFPEPGFQPEKLTAEQAKDLRLT